MKQLDQETDPKIVQALLASRNDYTIEDALENEMILNMGPQHPATHGVLRLLLRLDGERIIGCVPELGYLHRGYEKMAENMSYYEYIPHTDRLDYISPMANNVAWVLAVEKIAGIEVEPLDYRNIPGCTYTHPEIASVGYTEKAAREAGYETKVGKFPFTASGKASASGFKDGFVKVIFDARYGEWLGAHLIGENVTEMIAEVVVARKLETTGYEILKSVHPHPTMSEAIMEAVAAAYGEVIHI